MYMENNIVLKGDLHNVKDDRTGISKSDVVIIGRFINLLDLKNVYKFSFVMGGETYKFEKVIVVCSLSQELNALKKIGLFEAELYLNSEIDRVKYLCEKLGLDWVKKVK